MIGLTNKLKAILDFLKSISVVALAIAGLITAILSLIQLQRSENTTFWIALLIVGLGALLLICGYVFFKNASSDRTPGFTGTQKIGQTHLFGKLPRSIALIVLIGIPMFCAGGYLRWRYVHDLPSNKTLIMVANFESLDGQNYGVTEKIIEQLRAETSKYSDVQVIALGKSVTAQQGSAAARSIAEENKARICLWGWYSKTPENVLITVHFEVLKKPIELRLKQEKQELILPAKEMDSFQIQTRLSNEMAYLTLLTIGLARLELNDYPNAISLFSRAIELRSAPEQLIDPANVYYFRGNAYLSTNSFNQAIADFTESLKITPENFCTACAFNNRGEAYYSLHNLDAALADLVESRKHDSAPPQIHFNLGQIYREKGDFDNAIRSYTEAINRDANFVDAYKGRADLYFKRKDYAGTIENCNEILKHEPDNWQVLSNRGIAFAKKGDYERAIDDLNKSKLMNPNPTSKQETQGTGLIDKRWFLDEMTKCTAMIRSDPQAFGAYLRRGALYNTLTDYDRAIADFDEAIRLGGDLAEAYHQRGKAYEAVGKKDKAIADFSKFLELAQDETARKDAKEHLLRLGAVK